MIFRPHQYQIAAAKFIAAHPFSALYADPGTGKTAIMLMLLSALKKAGKLPPCLIVAPLRIATGVWPLEIKKWDQFNGITFEVLHGPSKLEAAKRRADIHIINNEGLEWAYKMGALRNYKMLIIDESSKYKSSPRKSWRVKLMHQIRKRFNRIHILTGSPAPNGLMDLHAQQYIVDGGATLGPYRTHYRQRYFYDINDGYGYPKYFPRSKADEEEIYKRIAPHAYRLDGDLLLDMPKLIFNDIFVDLPEDIKDMSFDALSEIGIDSPPTAAAAYALARQIAGGFTAKGMQIHDYKIEALSDLVAELQGKNALVFFYYRAEGEALTKAFKGAPRIDGTTTPKSSIELMDKWNRGLLPILLLHPAAAGHGLNLQAGGNDIVWFSFTDNYDDYYQAIRRIYRQGVKGTVRVHRLIAQDTIDEAMIKSLESKSDRQKALLDAVRELQERRK